MNSLYPIQSIDFTGNFRIWNRFSQNGNLEGGVISNLFIRSFSGKNSRLTEVPFWNCPEGIFYFIGQMLIEDGFSHSGCISCYRIAENSCECAENLPCSTPSGDASKRRQRRGLCHPDILVFVTSWPRSRQTLFFSLAIFYYGNGNVAFRRWRNGWMGRNPG